MVDYLSPGTSVLFSIQAIRGVINSPIMDLGDPGCNWREIADCNPFFLFYFCIFTQPGLHFWHLTV